MLRMFRNQLLTNIPCENFQSAYCAHHSRETALLDVMNRLLGSADEGQVSVLTLLDLSAAFDTLDHSILLTRLHIIFGIPGKALDWFSSYLSDRAQAVSVNGGVSSQKKLHYGVSQDSALGPILFTLYIQPLSKIISRSRCGHHKFADDTQLHQSSTPSDFHSLIVAVQLCVDYVGRWLAGNRLKLNNDKTDALLVRSRERVSVSQENHLRVRNNNTSFKVRVKNLGVYTDAVLFMVKHTDHISRSAYLEIRRISSIRHLLTTKATAQLMCSFVLSRLDYCSSAHRHQLLSDVQAAKSSKPCSEGCFLPEQT